MSNQRALFSHVDLRVRDRERSAAFYDALLGSFGLKRRDVEEWTSYYDASIASPGPEDFVWFGFTQDPSISPNSNRIAFMAESSADVERVADLLRTIGAADVDGPNYDEGPGYYAVFFSDPDGHLLEVCFRTQ
ncbi:MAG: VOC family protein [Candidatus Eremiobacteraeota bacterium]|nr:VOC family protein [Candidatus Eremiobacteraeota bacterium]